MIYFDQASLQKPCVDMFDMGNLFKEEYWYNPSAAYSAASSANNIIEWNRAVIAESINAEPEEIFFTSGSTEAINWFCRNLGDYEVYTTAIEHPAILNSIIKPILMRLNEDTTIKWEIPPETFPIIITAYVNNEIGTICQFDEMPQNRILFVDATQAFGHIPIDVKKIKADFLCASAQKFGGLAGTGFIYISSEMLNVFSDGKHFIQYGGNQERGIRAGTSNTFGINAMGKAAIASLHDRHNKNIKISHIRDYMYHELLNIPCAHLNGTSNWNKRWVGNLNYRFDGYKGEELMSWFDANEIYVSTGSACHAKSGHPSHVLMGIGLSEDEANSSIRFSFNEDNTLDEAKSVIEILKQGLQVLNHD